MTKLLLQLKQSFACLMASQVQTRIGLQKVTVKPPKDWRKAIITGRKTRRRFPVTGCN
jgi:hypothetical protein